MVTQLCALLLARADAPGVVACVVLDAAGLPSKDVTYAQHKIGPLTVEVLEGFRCGHMVHIVLRYRTLERLLHLPVFLRCSGG